MLYESRVNKTMPKVLKGERSREISASETEIRRK